MSLITISMLWEKLNSLEQTLKAIQSKQVEQSFEELSLGKTAKMLKLGQDSVIRLVNNGQLKARKYRDNKHKVRYRFRPADIKEYQENSFKVPVNYNTMEIEDAHSMALRIRKRIVGV
jgi:hypothetical protein